MSNLINGNETNMLIHMSDEEFKWYALGWSNQFIRYLVGSWSKLKINDIIMLTSDKSQSIKCKIIDKIVSINLNSLLNESNYISLYPMSQNYRTTLQYVTQKLKNQSIPKDINIDIKLALFTIKII